MERVNFSIQIQVMSEGYTHDQFAGNYFFAVVDVYCRCVASWSFPKLIAAECFR